MADHPELPEENESSPGSLPLTPQPVTAEDRRDMLCTFLPIAGIEFLLSAIMVVVYVCIDRFTFPVLYGALLGSLVSIGNFAVMALSLMKAERAETVAKGQLQAQGKYVLRMLVLLGVLILALKSGYFSPLPTLLPLCFMRVAIYISQICYHIFKKHHNKEANS